MKHSDDPIYKEQIEFIKNLWKKNEQLPFRFFEIESNLRMNTIASSIH